MKKITIFMIFLVVTSCSERFPSDQEQENDNHIAELSGYISGQLGIEERLYRVTGDIIVPKDHILEIAAGTTFRFDPHTAFYVDGNIQAVGTVDEPIVFTSPEGHWQGIKISNSMGQVPSRFEFAEISNIQNPDTSFYGNGSLYIRYGAADIKNCIFNNNNSRTGGGLGAEYCQITVQNSIFSNNTAVSFGGGVFLNGCQSYVLNNTFYNNEAVNISGGLAILDWRDTEIQNNIFYKNTAVNGNPSYHIYPDSTDPEVNEYLFIFNYNYDGSVLGSPSLISNTNFRLRDDSPCINAGNPDSTFNDTDGSRNDLGAYGGPGGDW